MNTTSNNNTGAAIAHHFRCSSWIKIIDLLARATRNSVETQKIHKDMASIPSGYIAQFMVFQVISSLIEHFLKADWQLVCARLDVERAVLLDDRRIRPGLLAQELLVSGEDHRHGSHKGYDPIAIARACWRRLGRGSREGASTIEQQVVRVITGRYERTVVRKLREIGLAILVTNNYPKDLLPAVYLSIGYYGWRMNGYHAACKRLGYIATSLSITEAANLVARLKYPHPREMSQAKFSQIERRVRHLKWLYQKHSQNGTYSHLHVSTFRNSSAALQPFPRSG